MQNRRQFIKNSAYASATLVTSTLGVQCIGNTTAKEKLGVALVGLGNYATNQLAPALQETSHCELVAIVTGTPDKVSIREQQYNITKANIYNYENFDRIKENPSIDIVYVVLPNGMHGEFTIRAAKAGKHVICEKPMEVSLEKAEAMVNACREAGKLLQIGYRLRYNPFHKELMRLGQEKIKGPVKMINTEFSFYGINGDNWRFTDPTLSGGGPLMDIGIYSIEAVCYTLGELPQTISAQSYKTVMDKLPQMEETIFWQMEFPSGAAANCSSSYVGRANFIRVSAEKGTFAVEPAFGYDGLKGMVNGEPMGFENTNQQAAQMDAFAQNIKEGTKVIASGEVGLIDMKIIETIYKAAKTGKKERINWS